MISGLIPAGITREQLKAQMASLPAIDPGDIAQAVANADLIRDDYAEAALQVIDATGPGKKAKIVRYGIGAACGLVLGVVVGKLV